MTPLARRRCEPCHAGKTHALTEEGAETLLAQLKGWELDRVRSCIHKQWTLKNFKEVLSKVNQIGGLAESEGHHPDLLIHDYKKLTVSLWTHIVRGLSENDFILAAKIDEIF
jgi:4a-hydroxytetrahydrobiopterin dehydratase